METHNLFEKLKANDNLHDFLAEYFDFELIDSIESSTKYYFKVDDISKVIGQDTSGGVFAIVGKGEIYNLPVIYISSEGQAGKVGRNFEEFFSIMISCPYWKDLLKFSGNGQLSEMKKANLYLNGELLEDFPEIVTIRNDITSNLNFTLILNPIETLYSSMISEPKYNIFSLEGDEFDSLFNSFVVTDNPLWKNK